MANMFHHYFHMITSSPFILLVPCYSFSLTHQALDIGYAKIPIDVFQRNITEKYTHTDPISLLQITTVVSSN